ncbi:MAG: septum formation protein Maf [Acidobacteria bacterium]|nr:septum formation protein Maf [Acidobacteriota bacterium]
MGIDVILASASPRRREILSLLFDGFRVVSPSVSEEAPGLSPAELTVELAERKAGRVFALNPGSMVIGADTVVVCGGEIMGKPKSAEHAAEMLSRLSGRSHEVLTGVACMAPEFHFSFSESTTVSMREMSPAEIQWYVKTGEPFGKAGAYAIQGNASVFIDRIDGNYLNVVGFPLSIFYGCLMKSRAGSDTEQR